MTEKSKNTFVSWLPILLVIAGYIVTVTLAFAQAKAEAKSEAATLRVEMNGKIEVLQKEDEHLKEGITDIKEILVRMERKLDRLANRDNRERGRGEGN